MHNEHLGLWEIPSFFPTPEKLAHELIDLADIQPGDVILEPSAGKGDLARIIHQRYPYNELIVIEKDPLLRYLLLTEGFRVVGDDFFQFTGQVDVVIQNPPFSNNYQDVDHFRHAWEVARRSVASILHAYSAFPHWERNDKPNQFKRWVDAHGLQRKRTEDGAFRFGEQPTETQTCIVWGSKWQHPQQPPPLREPSRTSRRPATTPTSSSSTTTPSTRREIPPTESRSWWGRGQLPLFNLTSATMASGRDGSSWSPHTGSSTRSTRMMEGN